MALQTPSYFDDFARMRTPAQDHDEWADYSLVISQLRDASREFNYPAISPQNLVSPAELLPVVVLWQGTRPCSFVNPKVLDAVSSRRQYEGCGNVFLMKDGRKIYPIVITRRPTRLRLSHVLGGRRHTVWFYDVEPETSTRHAVVGRVCHELDHLQGRLIVDIARERLVRVLENPTEAAPYILMRDGDGYVLRQGAEFVGCEVPPVSPDTLFVDGFWGDTLEIRSTFVPRGGELLPIRLSDTVKKLAAR